jgi:hypothetical protein
MADGELRSAIHISRVSEFTWGIQGVLGYVKCVCYLSRDQQLPGPTSSQHQIIIHGNLCTTKEPTCPVEGTEATRRWVGAYGATEDNGEMELKLP